MLPVLFELGELRVPSFWAMAVLGFVAALFVVRADVRWRGHNDVLAYDMILWAYIGGWIGAKLFMIPTGWEYFVEDPLAFLLSGSGWVWHGGVVGGAVAVAAMAYSRQRPIAEIADIAAPALAIGLAIGRIGCQLSGDGDYGIPTDLPWGMSYPNGVVPTTDNVHPTPVYEMLACFGIFAYLWKLRLSHPTPGSIMGWYLILSGVTRLTIEFVRRNPAWLLGFTTAQWFSAAAIVLGALILRRLAAPEPAPQT